MAAPNVTVKIVDESFVIRGFEDISTTIGAVFSKTSVSGATYNLLGLFGTTAQKNDGYMEISSAGEWAQKYNNKFGSTVKAPNPSETSGSYNGLTGSLATQWWSVANFLQYGGIAYVGGESGTVWTATNNPLINTGLLNDIDVVFALDNTSEQATIVENIVAGRDYDTIGIVGASGSYVGYGGGSGGASAQTGTITTRASGLGQYGICVYGSKVHLGLDINSDNLITTPLIADYAGCICRTDRDYAPWYPPAGMTRGRILNVLRLYDQPTPANQNTLYDAGINYALTMPGEGTFMFGDRTMASNTSTFSRINVSRLFIFLVNTIGPLAKRFLFELNDTITRELFVNTVTPILERIQGDRGITEFVVICDESNNPPAVVDANEFVADIQIKPTKSINFITIRFTNKNT
jgi:hypothetical protein